MAKKLVDIKSYVDSRAHDFKDHVKRAVGGEVTHFIDRLSRRGDVYIFSGIIRDYFLGISEIRDIDIIVDGELNLEEFISDFEYKRNSFGGFKIVLSGLSIDLWFLKDTWAINFQKSLNFELPKRIPNTAFFNFSSILFDYNQSEFYCSSHFLRFLRDKIIDIVFEPNANYPLCIVNSIYYADRLDMKLSKRLSTYIDKIVGVNSDKLECVQYKHFGRIVYDEEHIKERIRYWIDYYKGKPGFEEPNGECKLSNNYCTSSKYSPVWFEKLAEVRLGQRTKWTASNLERNTA